MPIKQRILSVRVATCPSGRPDVLLPDVSGVALSDLGVSRAARRVEELLPMVSERADTVLITGESGVGKTRVAQILHRHGDVGRSAPFIAVNCAAVSESLLEAELFG